MNIFSHFIFLIVSLLCPLLDTQVLLANGSLISPVLEHERAGTIIICTMFPETSRSLRQAKVAIGMVNYDFYLITNQTLFLHFRDTQGRPGPEAMEGKLFLLFPQSVNQFIGFKELVHSKEYI